MTLREKVGQMFFVRPDALDPSQTQQQINDADADGVTALTDAMSAVLADYPVGGVVLFGKNITGPQQLTDLTGQLHAAMDTPLLIAVDEEGGTVARLANHAAFDLPRTRAPPPLPRQAAHRRCGRCMPRSAATWTVTASTWTLPPTPTSTPTRTTRSSARGPFLPTRRPPPGWSPAAVEGFADTGVLCCVKHYPGHGDTAEDSHKSLAATP